MITAHGLLQEDNKTGIEEISNWIETPGKMTGRPVLSVLRFVLPLFTIAGLFYYLSTDNPIPLERG